MFRNPLSRAIHGLGTRSRMAFAHSRDAAGGSSRSQTCRACSQRRFSALPLRSRAYSSSQRLRIAASAVIRSVQRTAQRRVAQADRDSVRRRCSAPSRGAAVFESVRFRCRARHRRQSRSSPDCLTDERRQLGPRGARAIRGGGRLVTLRTRLTRRSSCLLGFSRPSSCSTCLSCSSSAGWLSGCAGS